MTRKQLHGICNGQSSKRSSEGEAVRLFGVQLAEGVMRKSISMGSLSHFASNTNQASSAELSESGVMAVGYLSDGVIQASGNVRERRKGVPWTEEEHRRFLIGLQKLGKGDWRGIAKNYVTTRNATQVASHAQKYFLRQNNLSRRKRRSSLFDVLPESEANSPEDPMANLVDMSCPLGQLTLEQGSRILSKNCVGNVQLSACRCPMPPTPQPGSLHRVTSYDHESVGFIPDVTHGSLTEGGKHKDSTVFAPEEPLSILSSSALPEAFLCWDKMFPPPRSSKFSTIVKPIATLSSVALKKEHETKLFKSEYNLDSIRPSPLSFQLIQPSRSSAFHIKGSSSCAGGANLEESISVL